MPIYMPKASAKPHSADEASASSVMPATYEDAMRELALQRGVAVKDYLASRKLPLDRLFLGAVKLVKPDAAAEGAWKPKAELSLTSR